MYSKTMLCAAFAKIAPTQNYLVMYVSNAEQRQEMNMGQSLEKGGQSALETASSSEYPALFLLKEMDNRRRLQE